MDTEHSTVTTCCLRWGVMVLYVIGLGLGDEKDITVRGLEAVRGSNKVVLEHYTSILGVEKEKLVSGS